MKVFETELPGVLVIEPAVFVDERGFFLETFHEVRYAGRGIPGDGLRFVQDNHSRSRRGVLRGLHYQITKPQGKLVRVTRGRVFDVTADVNPDSPTFGRWVGVELSDENHRQLWIPPGYAHGFCVLSDVVDFEYKCTELYHSEDEGGIRWDDPRLAIEWPVKEPIVSAKDARLPTLEQAERRWLPK
ncbi:MAG: dTDP-4-dehydrorhamnose 3,5-epimerase [Candidatus Dadabacteria bacterium]|nr:MAG: dTDP-4-dehydrorhamnose 3,5-epimerase [Candidatus Dadabacteria bacterium]